MGKMAAITGGMLMVMGAIGLGAIWGGVIYPALTNNTFLSNLYAILRILEAFEVLTFPWTDEILGITYEQLFWTLIFITSQPVTQVNFFGIILVDINLCMFALSIVIVTGGISSFAGASE